VLCCQEERKDELSDVAQAFGHHAPEVERARGAVTHASSRMDALQAPLSASLQTGQEESTQHGLSILQADSADFDDVGGAFPATSQSGLVTGLHRPAGSMEAGASVHCANRSCTCVGRCAASFWAQYCTQSSSTMSTPAREQALLVKGYSCHELLPNTVAISTRCCVCLL
jgi:hypothetical protein